ncbi:ABC transporter substrate-binding protein [Nitratireductor aquibiodomus]|nr:ABC transporter substrate-binding protein [Nitratireductor aquibiodomus]
MALMAFGVIGAGVPHTAWAETVTVGSEAALPPLDPQRTTGSVGLRIAAAIFDTLVREDLSKGGSGVPDIAPALAESWNVSDDGLTYTFKLRKGVSFHDGAAFDAQAVQTNFDRLLDKASPVFDERASSTMAFVTRWIASTRVVDAQTFELVLKEPFSGLPRLLTDRSMSIISPDALAKYEGDELGFHPVGTGPFKLGTLDQGQVLTLERNDDYWRGAPKIDTLVFKAVTDPTALAIAMQTGVLDIIPSASAEQVAQLANEPDLKVQYTDAANFYFIRLNMNAEHTNDVRFRQALNYAVNRDFISALFGGQAVPRGGPVPAGNEITELASGKVKEYAYDPEKAKALLAETGFETPIELEILAPNNGPGFGLSPQLMVLVQQDLAAVGVDLKPRLLEFTTMISTERPGYADDVHGSYNGWVTGAGSAYVFERLFASAQQPPQGVNRGWYKNVEVDENLNAARSEQDGAKRSALYLAAAAKIAEDAPYVFLYQDRLPRIIRSNIKGIEPAASVYIDFSQVSVD